MLHWLFSVGHSWTQRGWMRAHALKWSVKEWSFLRYVGCFFFYLNISVNHGGIKKSFTAAELFVGLCAIWSICQMATWKRAIRRRLQSENSVSSFSSPPTYPHERALIYTMNPLSSIYFSFLKSEGDINQWLSYTHRLTTQWLLPHDVWGLLAGLEFYLLHHMIYTPLLTSNACLYILENNNNNNKKEEILWINQATNPEITESGFFWLLSHPVCLIHREQYHHCTLVHCWVIMKKSVITGDRATENNLPLNWCCWNMQSHLCCVSTPSLKDRLALKLQ